MVHTVWALRHGERRDSVDPDWADHAAFVDDPGMTTAGHEQIRKAADRLCEAGVEEIYASPFYRAVQSAAHVAEALDLPLKLERGLCEGLRSGRFSVDAYPELRDRSTLREEFPRIDTGYDSRFDPTYPETSAEYIARNGETTRALVSESTADRILVVGHGATVVGVVAGLTGSEDGISNPPPLASLTRLEHRDDWQLGTVADTDHLS